MGSSPTGIQKAEYSPEFRFLQGYLSNYSTCRIKQNEMLKRSQAIHQHNPILLPILIYTYSYCYIWCHEFHLGKILESKIHMEVATLSMCVTTLQQLTKSLSSLYALSLHAMLQRPSETSL